MKLAVFTLVTGILTAYLWVHIITTMAATVFKPGLFSVVYITAPTQEVAKKIARGLVENQLAACVNIVPGITSIYKWEGKIEEDSELLLMVKTRTQKIVELTAYVKANHPYSVPEVISTPIESGHDLYLKFLNDSIPEKS
uniref:Uncharacterized protein n=2 Tax=Cuerna arida TaxID=1464854 RepID=A0A1B6FXF1_9HEMI